MALGNGMAPYHAMAELKHAVLPKNYMSVNGPNNVYLISLIVKATTILVPLSVLTMFHSPPYLQLQKGRMIVCDIILSF